jgi:two-component system, cell cycle sensor histidine kinase PleC
MLRSVAAQSSTLRSWRGRAASCFAFARTIPSLTTAREAAKRSRDSVKRSIARAMAKARMTWMAAALAAATLCRGISRLSGVPGELVRKSLAAARRHVVSRLLRGPAAPLRSIAARYAALRSRRGGAASYSTIGQAIVSRTGAVLRTRLPLTKRHAPGLWRKALSWTRRRRAALAERARRIFVGRRLARSFAAATKPRSPSAWRRVQRAMVETRTEWIAGITAGVPLALCGMFFWMSWHAREIVIADTYASGSNLARSVEQFVARTMETVDLSLRVATAEIAADAPRASKDVHRLLASQVRQSPQITSIVLIDPNGHVTSSSEELPGLPIDVSKKKYFTHAGGGGAIRVTMEQPVTPRSDGKRVIFASRRITRSDGRLLGVIAATINADYIQRFLSTLHVGAQGSIALHTTDGTLLVRQPALDADIGKNFSSAPLFQDWLPWASSGVFPSSDGADRRWRIVGFQRVERLPLVAEVALSRDEVLADWQRTTLWQAGVGGLILVLSGLTALALHQQLRERRNAHRQLSETVRELENARRAAEESSRVKSQFMANMSHELRTPLNAIIGFSEVIRDAHVGPVDTRYQGYAQDIHSSGHHLLGLINDVLDLSKIEAGRLTLHEEPVDLTKLAGDCQRLLAERFRTAQLALVIELPAHVPYVRADELRLKQILLNLLSNAAKFTPAGGRVVLAVEVMPEGAIRLSVADTGVGMRPEEIPLALQPFRQVDSSLNRRYDGAGLGLPLARTLAELHGGRLAIESAPGEGTTVSITLPARRVLRESGATAPRKSSPEGHADSRSTRRSAANRNTSTRAVQLG